MLEWCDRTLFLSPVYFALCTSEKEFRKELRKMDVAPEIWPAFISNEQSHATVHHFVSGDKSSAIVCIKPYIERDPIEVAALLVHEAVHVWQEVRENIGERAPCSEFEAYSIQAIAQELMLEYRKQVYGK